MPAPQVRFGNYDEEEDHSGAAKTLLRAQRLRGMLDQLAPMLHDLVKSPHLASALSRLGGPSKLEQAMLTVAADEVDTESGGTTRYADNLPATLAVSFLSDAALEEIAEAHFQDEQEQNPFHLKPGDFDIPGD
jgi:hypothetical protein